MVDVSPTLAAIHTCMPREPRAGPLYVCSIDDHMRCLWNARIGCRPVGTDGDSLSQQESYGHQIRIVRTAELSRWCGIYPSPSSLRIYEKATYTYSGTLWYCLISSHRHTTIFASSRVTTCLATIQKQNPTRWMISDDA